MTRMSPAENLLKDLGVTAAKEIDIEAIGYHRGACIKYRPLSGCEGRIIGANDRAVITVNSKAIPSRQRFTAAHELGHWHYHRGRSLICLPDDISNPAKGTPHSERIADEYAADLLMPQFLFRPMAYQAGKVSFAAVESLRKEFKTSITATAIRLVQYGPEIAMLVCHNPSGRKWFCRSHDIPERWFARDDLDTDSYAVDVLNGKIKQSSQTLIAADAWFDHWDAEKFELYEETYRITDNEILTFLVFEDDEMLEEH